MQLGQVQDSRQGRGFFALESLPLFVVEVDDVAVAVAMTTSITALSVVLVC